MFSFKLVNMITCARSNCYRASIGRIHRPLYRRVYPVRLVFPNGYSITIRYNEPRSIIKLPFDINSLATEEQRKRRLLLRTRVDVDKDTSTNDISFRSNSIAQQLVKRRSANK
ncbi:hypothetical protein GJ496_003678 [Pomphorhynchus laevis]|nr:hypothetical protein GJ496_003678 [Pomphorhynchus laevis]